MGGSGVVHIVGKQGERGGDVPALLGILHIQAQVETGLQESSTCGIAIETSDVDIAILAQLTQEGSILVGVGKQATGHGRACRCSHKSCQCNNFLLH